jgi:MFS family permease
MHRFTENFPTVVESSTATGWLTSILQLGGLFGSLAAGVLSEIISRKYTMFVACCWVILGSFLYVGAQPGVPALLYAGRFFTGIGVGLFSGVGPLYNAELSAPHMRGLLVSFYQLATILGIMLSFWVGYGSNYIGGTGAGQSDLAWRLPSIIQGIPAVCLAFGIWFMPFSPRWLVKVGRDEEARSTLAWMRNLPIDHDDVDVEYLEIKAEALFEQKAFVRDFPKLAEKGNSRLTQQFSQYVMCFRSKDNFKRVCIAWLVMFWQQWSGIDAIIYYASQIFQSLGLTSGTIALLATGVTGVVFLISTIPAMVSHSHFLHPISHQLTALYLANHRPCRPQTHAPRRLRRHGRQHDNRRRHRLPIPPRLARPRRRRLGRRRPRLALHRRFRRDLGPRLLDARLRNLPPVHPRERSFDRRFEQLDQQFRDCVLRAAYVGGVGVGDVHFLCWVFDGGDCVGLVLFARD